MTPANVMMQLDGLMWAGLRAPRAPQRILLWRDVMRTIMFSQGLRDATDWQVVAAVDTVEAGSEIDASGGTVYGALIDSIYDVANEPLVWLISNLDVTLTATTIDAGSDTVGFGDSTAAGDSAYGALLKIAPATSATNSEFGCVAFPAGLIFDAGIFVCADGEESTAPTDLDVRTYVVYRDTAEVQV